MLASSGRRACGQPVSGMTTLLHAVHSETHSRLSEGDVARLTDGRLLAVYQRSGPEGDDFDRMDLVVQTSSDGGGTWTPPAVLVSAGEAGQNVMSPSLLRLHASGGLLLFYLRKNAHNDARLYVRRLDDATLSLGEPVLALPAEGYHVVNNSRVAQLTDGRLVVPAAFHPEDGEAVWSPRRMYGQPRVFYSDDEGATWQRGSDPHPLPDDVQLQEPGVVELQDGRLLMWMRTNAGVQYESVSTDRGATWSPPRPGPLASPLSPATLARSPWAGELVAVWNDHGGDHPFPASEPGYWAVGVRTPLAVALSYDDGRTWQRSRILEDAPDLHFSYPSITFDGERMIVSYSVCMHGSFCDYKVVTVDREWVHGH